MIGVATAIPARLAILGHPDFAAAEHSTKWVEERLDLSGVSAAPLAAPPADGEEPKVCRDVDVEVNGKRFSVAMWVPETAPVVAVAGGAGGGVRARPKPAPASGAAAGGSRGRAGALPGTIRKGVVARGGPGRTRPPGWLLPAPKMEEQSN